MRINHHAILKYHKANTQTTENQTKQKKKD